MQRLDKKSLRMIHKCVIFRPRMAPYSGITQNLIVGCIEMKNPTHSLLDRDNLNLVLDNLKLGVVAHTPERIITVFNKAAEKITGYRNAPFATALRNFSKRPKNIL